ncbi:hypothetical protein VTN96DRAFT_2698 [Rasamsonia emersonii]
MCCEPATTTRDLPRVLVISSVKQLPFVERSIQCQQGRQGSTPHDTGRNGFSTTDPPQPGRDTITRISSKTAS